MADTRKMKSLLSVMSQGQHFLVTGLNFTSFIFDIEFESLKLLPFLFNFLSYELNSLFDINSVFFFFFCERIIVKTFV